MTNAATKTRAPAGGAFGANGEWYEGGKFINTVAQNAKGSAKSVTAQGKREIEPYVWAVAPEAGMFSIYSRWNALWVRGVNGYEPVNETALAYYGTTREEVQSKIDAYEAGQRWEAA
jgi:hypothetical protein